MYERRFGRAPEIITDLRPDGSNRKLYRLAGAPSAIGVHGPDHEENRAFISFSRSLRSAGLPVPEIYEVDEKRGIYLEEDLSDTTLFDALVTARQGDRFPEGMIPVYERVIDMLPRFQVEGGRVIDFSVAYPRAEFDRQAIMWDLNYFKYHFVKLARIPFNEERLEQDFVRLCDFLLRADRSHFLYRDFQSRNIMLRGGEPWFIDYQGGRRGALQYDLASLLYDAKAAIPDDVRAHLFDRYLDRLASWLPVDRGEFRELYVGYVLVRIMQAMGAYGYRGFFEGKPHFLASVPYAVANIESIMARVDLPVEIPELRAVFGEIARREDLRAAHQGADGLDRERKAKPEHTRRPESQPEEASTEPPTLTLHIRSFSYKRGYPEDTTGHGGGFVFDCRALHNPGRYEEYRPLCGRDAPVIEFLERGEEVERYFEAVRHLVDAAVENYLERGFPDLSVSFGCTGGQHRSVYFSERLARHVRETFPRVQVAVHHREEELWMR